jgi:hypothetical protein
LLGADRWPLITVVHEPEAAPVPEASSVGDRTATVVSPAGVLRADRDAAVLRVATADGATDDDLVHPGLWPVAAVFARWRGAETLHAGAVRLRGESGAWVVMADSGGGKSSFLAMLALDGHEILADDLIVIEDGACHAGPRCLDLRHDAAERLDLAGRPTSWARATSRIRLGLPPCAASRPVSGFVELDWGRDVGVQQRTPSDALAVLARHRRVIGLGAELECLLELAGRPLVCLTRPRDWASAQTGARALLATISPEIPGFAQGT